MLTVNGVISGAGGTTVQGPASRGRGIVILTGNNTYSGATTVGYGGTLYVDGNQPATAVTVTDDGTFDDDGTTGSVDNSGYVELLGGVQADQCPGVVSIDGNLILETGSQLFTMIGTCGKPPAQTVGSARVSGAISIAKGAGLSVSLIGDKPQVACLLSSQVSLTGQFQGIGQGSTEPDPSGGKVVFSYDTPGGAGCDAHAFTATTGVH
jgi:autotransporter-associated beta strand protein